MKPSITLKFGEAKTVIQMEDGVVEIKIQGRLEEVLHKFGGPNKFGLMPSGTVSVEIEGHEPVHPLEELISRPDSSDRD